MIGNRIGSTCQLALSTCRMMMKSYFLLKQTILPKGFYDLSLSVVWTMNHSFHKAQLLPAIKWYESHLLYWSFSDIFWYCRMPFYDHFSSQPAKYVFVITRRKCGFRLIVSSFLVNLHCIEGSLSASSKKILSSKIEWKTKAKKYIPVLAWWLKGKANQHTKLCEKKLYFYKHCKTKMK